MPDMSKRNTSKTVHKLSLDKRAAIPVAAVLIFFFGYMLAQPDSPTVTTSVRPNGLSRRTGLANVNVTSVQPEPLDTTLPEPSYQSVPAAAATSSPQAAATTDGSAIANSGVQTPEAASTPGQNTDPLVLLNELDSSNIHVKSSALNTSLEL